MLKKTERGFTLIELLVVIAIIGVLSSVVLASLNSARGKGNDSKVKAQLSSFRASAELYYDTNAGYGTSSIGSVAGSGLCAPAANDTSGVAEYLLGTNYPTGVGATIKCFSDPDEYAVWATLPFVQKTWCVDSRGKSRQYETAPADGSVKCE